MRVSTRTAMASIAPQFTCWIVVVAALLQLATADDAQVTQLGRSVGQFGNDLYQVLAARPGGLILSPLSIHAAMSMVHMGAAGNSMVQLHKGLHLSGSHEEILSGVQGLLSSVQGNKNSTVAIANSIFIEKTYSVKPTFLNDARTYFGSEVELVDFQTNPEAARLKANSWVEEHTNHKITNLFKSGAVTPNTRLLLVNAVYFKGVWASPFDASKTVERPFHVGVDSTKPVPMMFTNRKFPYGQHSETGCAILKIPYEGGVSMAVFLPEESIPLATLEDQLKDVDLIDIVPTHETEVALGFPKVTLESRFDLNDALIQLNMTDIFGSAADLSGISEAKDLYISDVVHKAYIEIDEHGTEAAAATGVGIQVMSGPTPLQFTIDRPFMFLLYDERTRTQLFRGRYMGPP